MGMRRGGGKGFQPNNEYGREVRRRRRRMERRGLTDEELRRRERYIADDREQDTEQQRIGNRGNAVCHGCGLIHRGPDTGVYLPHVAPSELAKEEGMRAAGLKGTHINHGTFCPDCRLAQHELAVESLERRYGPNWRERLQDAGQDPDMTVMG